MSSSAKRCLRSAVSASLLFCLLPGLLFLDGCREGSTTAQDFTQEAGDTLYCPILLSAEGGGFDLTSIFFPYLRLDVSDDRGQRRSKSDTIPEGMDVVNAIIASLAAGDADSYARLTRGDDGVEVNDPEWNRFNRWQSLKVDWNTARITAWLDLRIKNLLAYEVLVARPWGEEVFYFFYVVEFNGQQFNFCGQLDARIRVLLESIAGTRKLYDLEPLAALPELKSSNLLTLSLFEPAELMPGHDGPQLYFELECIESSTSEDVQKLAESYRTARESLLELLDVQDMHSEAFSRLQGVLTAESQAANVRFFSRLEPGFYTGQIEHMLLQLPPRVRGIIRNEDSVLLFAGEREENGPGILHHRATNIDGNYQFSSISLQNDWTRTIAHPVVQRNLEELLQESCLMRDAALYE